MRLRTLHGLSALLIAAYALVHLANHLVGLQGVQAHIAFMDAARKLYRNPFVEPVLLLAVAGQIVSGAILFIRGWRERRGLVSWLQAGSGAYLALFLLNHVAAVLYGRAVLHLDTNFYYAAAGLHVAPFQYFFAPYYFLAVLALFVHLACALSWQLPGRARLVLAPAALAGLGAALLIVLSLAGVLYPVDVPAQFKATFGAPGP
jgi:succinate dehydrogenase/fumarate reductase cytochrome b subunit